MEIKFEYLAVKPNGYILKEIFTIKEIENDCADTWLKVNLVGVTSVIHRRQFVGLTDENGTDFYMSDIAEFDNGDRFVLKMEDWLQVYVDWIGDPECEDQARDLYRISRAEIIGNTYENPELLEK